MPRRSPASAATSRSPTGPAALTSGDDGSLAPSFTSFYIRFLADATVTFDWNYTSADLGLAPFTDAFGYVLAGNVPGLFPGFTKLTTDRGPLTQSGPGSVFVSAGQYFGFAMQSDNFGGPATAALSNLRIEQVQVQLPEPGSVALLAAALAAATVSTRRRRTA